VIEVSTGTPPTAGRRSGPDAVARRHAVRALLRSSLVSVLLVVLYFAVPFTDELVTPTGLLLVGGLVGLTALMTWHLRSIVTSPYPRARAAAALTTSLTVFLVLFSTVYVLMSRSDHDSFSEPLSRLDAAYFTITVFATVGFGDIIAVSAPARAVTTVQMLGDVVLVGVVARLVVGAVRRGLERRPDTQSSPDPKETSP
jgi:hypothetical protein